MAERKRPMAGCPGCGAPLIPTCAFSGYEFYCLECARRVTFFGPIRLTADEHHQERYDALKVEWDEHAGSKLLADGGYHRDCSACAGGREPHTAHAADEERAAHEAALAWLAARSGS